MSPDFGFASAVNSRPVRDGDLHLFYYTGANPAICNRRCGVYSTGFPSNPRFHEIAEALLSKVKIPPRTEGAITRPDQTGR